MGAALLERQVSKPVVVKLGLVAQLPQREEAHVRHRELEDKGVQDLTYLEHPPLVGHAPLLRYLPVPCVFALLPQQTC